MLQQYLVRGLKAGFVAGLVLGLFVALVVNPVIGMAEGLAGDHGHADEHGDADGSVVSALTTKIVSVLGGIFWALLLGVVTFGVAYYFLEPAIPGAGDTQSFLLAAAGFVTVSGAPWLVLPPQPPGVSEGLPVNTRIGLYGGMMVAGLVTCGLAGYAYTRLSDRGQSVALAGAATPFVLLGGLSLLAPANPTGATVSDTFITGFRAFVAFSQAMVWIVLASAHAWLLRRDAQSSVDRPAKYGEPTASAD